MRSDRWKKVLLLAIVAGLVFIYFYAGLDRYTSLESLKSSKESLFTLYNEHTALFIFVYFVGYIMMAAASLPGATVVSLAGGAIFGLGLATLIVSFASTLGATCACAAARYLFRDWVQERFGERLNMINEGIEREGAFYLFTLRLIPVFPFFLINLAMGVTPMRFRTFYWVSQLGMLPGTLVYINAGSALGQIESLSGILSPNLILSFALIGVFPLAAKKALSFYKAKKDA